MTRSDAPVLIGRYAIHDEIACGGMASVHIGRLVGPAGFSRTVAVKRLHPTYARDPEFVAMFLDEARLCGRVRHPNVVSMLDVVATRGELFLVMDYVAGESVARLLRAARSRNEEVPLPIVSSIVAGALHGLHAAHEARGERGEPLEIVHRDVSPQNVLVGIDGLARVVDFGVAKATGRLQSSRDGQLKGKIAYMAPEQVRAAAVDRRTDVYAASVMLWEILTGRRLFDAESEAGIVGKILEEPVTPPSHYVGSLPAGLDELVLRGLSRKRDRRFPTARDMATALESIVRPALASDVGAWVERIAGEVLHRRSTRIAEIESETGNSLEEAKATLALSQSEPTPSSSVEEPAPSAHSAPSAERATEPRARRFRAPAVAAIVAAAIAGAAIAIAARETTAKAPGSASPQASPSPVPSSANLTNAANEPSAASGTSAANEPAPSAMSKPATVATPKKAPTKTPVAPAAKKPSASALPPNCRTIDAKGIWHIDPKCL